MTTGTVPPSISGSTPTLTISSSTTAVTGSTSNITNILLLHI
jgi:hypothetical protein